MIYLKEDKKLGQLVTKMRWDKVAAGSENNSIKEGWQWQLSTP